MTPIAVQKTVKNTPLTPDWMNSDNQLPYIFTCRGAKYVAENALNARGQETHMMKVKYDA